MLEILRGLEGFHLYIAHQVGLPTSFSSQGDALSLWLTFKCCKAPPFFCSHGGEWIASHDVVEDAFVSIAKDARFHVSHEQTHVLFPLPFCLFINGLTLFYQLMAFALQWMWSSPIPPKYTWSLKLFHLVGWRNSGNHGKKRTLS